jgi:GntR family transcriptional regulator/MocR family aminotransferase
VGTAADLELSLTGSGPLAEQIRRQIAALIRGGTLAPGDLLPSTRALAARLSVSRATVVAAYELLALDGLIRSRPGIGAIVQPSPPPALRDVAVGGDSLEPDALWEDITPPRARAWESPAAFNFRLGRPSVEHFPYPRWRALLSEQFRARAWADGSYPDPAGDPELRTAIARHITLSRGLAVDAERIVVTSGAQQAIDLAARVLAAPGDVVAVEDPGYPPAHAALRANRLHVAGVAVDEHGLLVDRIPARARLVYVTPSHQFPLGTTMSHTRRVALLDWAAQHDAVIVEDDYDTEFRYAGQPLPPLHQLDEAGRVAYVGSFSKTLLPALRIGFLVATPRVVAALARAKFAADFGAPAHLQRALATFIDEGGFARHIRRMRRVYEQRHHLIRTVLLDDFADVLQPIDSLAGLHLAARLPAARDDRAITRAAQERDVGLGALSRCAVEQRSQQGLLFGYGAIPTDRIEAGLARLRQVLRS